MGEKKYIVNLTFDYEPWLVNSIQVLSMALSFAIRQKYNKHRPVKLVNRLISCVFWFKVHTSLDTALEPSRGGLSFPFPSIQAGLSDSSNEQNKAHTWLCDFKVGPQKMKFQTFSFGLLTVAAVNCHVVKTVKQPWGESHVLRSLFLPVPWRNWDFLPTAIMEVDAPLGGSS